ncbi:hypothetical protein [Solirubrum puertoriconensis]|uniref:Uncharacterized protein n=1 Tax=Solirubrum puertoriconensis TaxID=1751427 RepID=A0A9X0L3N8_SOLP1|nr:hypothetical protein [Solirubrum puertoriconensis]KUG06696.1 hypothetical protein ASU33_04990 [Solirubrum puertoriconensis]
MIKLLRLTASLLLGSILLYIITLNVRLYHQPNTDGGTNSMNADLLAQLRHLKAQLHAGAAHDMQEIYPEGHVFLNAFYSLCWSEVAAAASPQTMLHQEATAESSWAVKEIASPAGQQVFDATLPLPHGAFYNGWLGYSLGKLLLSQPAAKRRPGDVELFRRTCQQIAAVLADAGTPFPESYARGAWPADAAVCAAALATHDRVFTPLYQELLQVWLQRVATHTDMRGMIPHSVEAQSGKVLESARGSSQSLLLSMLYEIDPAYARPHYMLYKQHFADERLGLPGFREHPHGVDGASDIDSGPVVWVSEALLRL